MVNIEIQVREVKGVFAEKVLEAALEFFFFIFNSNHRFVACERYEPNKDSVKLLQDCGGKFQSKEQMYDQIEENKNQADELGEK